MDNISLTLPLKTLALRNAANMLHRLADDLDQEAVGPALTSNPDFDTDKNWDKAPEAQVETVEEGPEVFTKPEGWVDPDEVAPAPAPEAPVETEAPAPQSDFIDTDARGMAWDERIHASTRTKLVNGNWKNKRGVDPQYLAQVEAELMGVPGAAPAVEPETPAAPPPPAAQATPTTIDTFPALMAFITGNKIGPDKVLEAVKSVGLESLPLLAAHPDKIPAVAEALGA